MRAPCFRFITTALFGLFAAVPLRGQTTVDLTQHVGIDPYGSYSGSDVDHIDMNSGNLSVQIPLFTLPQKGKLTLGYQLVLNNNGWAPQSTCDEYGCINMWTRSTNLGPAVVPIEDPWVSSYALTSDAAVAQQCVTAGDGTTYCKSGYSYPWQAVMGYNIVEPDGAQHALLVDGSNDTTLRTYDGSEYLYTPDFLYPFDLYYNETTTMSSPASRHAAYLTNAYAGGFGDTGYRAGGTVITPAGIRYCNPDPYGPASFTPSLYNPNPNTNPCGTGSSNQPIGPTTEVISDTNGNQITVTPAWYTGNSYFSNGNNSIITDSVGRTFSGLPAPTASTSGCPVITDPEGIPVTADSSSTWNVPGPNGSVSYLICYKNISIDTKFDMWSISGTENQYSPCPDTYTPGYEGTLYCDANWQYITVPSDPITVIQSIVLPNGTFWGFSYNPSADHNGGDSGTYGDIWQIVLPSGGRIQYSYLPANPNHVDGNRYINSRTMVPSPGTGESSAIWQYSWNPAEYLGRWGCNRAQDSTISGPDGTITSYTHIYNSASPVGCWPSTSTVSTTGASGETESTTTNFNLIGFANPQPATNIPLDYPLQWASGTSPWAGSYIGVQSLPSSTTTTVSSGGSSYSATTTYTYDSSGAPATPPGCTLAGEYYTSGFVSYGSELYAYQANDLCTPFETSDTTSFQKFGWSLDSNSWAGWSYKQQSSSLAVSAPMGARTGTTITGTTGQLLSSSTTSYMWQQPGSYYALNLMDRPYQATTYAGAPSSSGSYVGVPVAAQTTYAYDDPSWNQGGLGNLTAVSQMNSLGAFLVTHLHYNAQGYNDQTQDPRGVLSTVSGFDCSGGSSNYTPTGSSASVAVYSQTIVKALGTSVAETSTALRDCNTGAVAQSTDPNGQSTSTWYDAGGNPLLVTYPDGGSTGYNYHGYATPLHITKTVAASPSPSLVSDTFEDGFGRTIHSYAAPGYSASPQGAAVDTGYDGMGRVVSVSNPYYSQSDATYGVTTSSYDGLNRKIGQTDSDGVSTQSWTYVGPTVQYKDENSHQWNRTYDEMGRLTQVVEPGTLTTSYTYDVLSNLLSVSQLGAGSGDTPRTRTFSYDSLSRLVCVSNTEISSPQQTQGTCPTAASSSYVSGTTQYTYDGNGNVVSKTMPAVNASSGTHTVGYNYDLLNRLLSKSYYDGSTPLSCYEYDSPSVANGIGRLSNAWTLRASAGSCGDTFSTGNGYLTARQIAAYDSLGRLWSETQCTNSGCRNSNPCQTSTGAYQSYTYDLAGGLVCAGNGIASTPGASNPPAFAYGYDASGRLASASSNSWSQYPSSLYSVTNYGPIGPLNWNLSGGNISVTQGFTNRLWVNSINATGQVP